ncbi:unnamed protein product [Protopolystoma xenopodis]|uniref:Uncharacterized protein n=1 Tax=Protopolystoma xenopodis TaxID=117903 RepID=A0A448XFM8_9PLAT|nr:unnamed protein product [Protopolystoma xenopodis]
MTFCDLLCSPPPCLRGYFNFPSKHSMLDRIKLPPEMSPLSCFRPFTSSTSSSCPVDSFHFIIELTPSHYLLSSPIPTPFSTGYPSH